MLHVFRQMHVMQVAGTLLTKALAKMVDNNLALGIIEEEARVGEVDPQMVVLSATTAYNRAFEVCLLATSIHVLQDFHPLAAGPASPAGGFVRSLCEVIGT